MKYKSQSRLDNILKSHTSKDTILHLLKHEKNNYETNISKLSNYQSTDIGKNELINMFQFVSNSDKKLVDELKSNKKQKLKKRETIKEMKEFRGFIDNKLKNYDINLKTLTSDK